MLCPSFCLASTLVLVCFVVSLRLCDANADASASGNFATYSGYSAVVADNVTSQFTPTLFHCLVYSTVTPQTNGVSYNDATKQCKVLPATNNEIQVQLRTNVGWVTYVKDISGESRVIFKATGAIAPSANATQVNIGPVFLGASSSTYLTTSFSTAMSPTCNCLYRNGIIDSWQSTTAKPSKIQIEVYSGNLRVVNFFFNAIGQSLSSWFQITNLVGAFPYNLQNMRMISYSAFNISYYDVRGFNIAYNYSTCPSDAYYFGAVSDVNFCSYIVAPVPNLFYSQIRDGAPAMSNFRGLADYFIVRASYPSRVAFI